MDKREVAARVRKLIKKNAAPRDLWEWTPDDRDRDASGPASGFLDDRPTSAAGWTATLTTPVGAVIREGTISWHDAGTGKREHQYVATRAAEALGLDWEQAEYLFDRTRTPAEVAEALKAIEDTGTFTVPQDWQP